MKFTHDGQPRSQDKDERLCAFRDPALHGIAEENGNADHGTPVAAMRHLGWRPVSVAVPDVFVIRVRDERPPADRPARFAINCSSLET